MKSYALFYRYSIPRLSNAYDEGKHSVSAYKIIEQMLSTSKQGQEEKARIKYSLVLGEPYSFLSS